MTGKIQWARVHGDVKMNLRRGAWFKVLELRELEAVIEVNKKPLTVLKALVEIVDRPPPHWTIVRPSIGDTRAPAQEYGVCPSCGERAVIKRRAKRMQCPNCKREYAVAWDGIYSP